MSLHHNHFCKHCDLHWSCPSGCPFPYDVSKYHDCAERELANRRLKRMLADYPQCQYGCRSLPCVHDKLADRIKPRNGELQGEYVRPPIRDGVVICNENAHSARLVEQRRQEYWEARKDYVEPDVTTHYVSDGKVALQRVVQQQWVKAKIEAIAEKFPEHLRGLIKEHRK